MKEMRSQMKELVEVGTVSGRVGELGGSFGMGLQARILKLTPIICLVLERNDLFIYLFEQNVYLFIYCPLIFIYTLCCRLQINIAVLFQFWFLS